VEKLSETVIQSLWAPATYAKLLFLLVTSPIWFPLAKVMFKELLPALNATEDEQVLRRKPGEDPFLNVPLASHRRRTAAAGSSARPALRRRP
jgi:hypothetical protein